MNRYVVVEGSNLGHCCIEYTVINIDAKKDSAYSELVCECLRKKDAEMICEALNQGENK